LATDFEDHLARAVGPDVFFVQLDITVIKFDLAGFDVLRQKGFSLVVELSDGAANRRAPLPNHLPTQFAAV
jgi:hypothetical protein